MTKRLIARSIIVAIVALLMWGGCALVSMGLTLAWAKVAVIAIRDIGWAAVFLIWYRDVIIFVEFLALAGSK